MNIFAINDAINHLSQAQRLWQTGDLEHEAELQKQVFNMYQRLGRAYELSSQLDEASDVYRDMLMLARRQREPGMECIALNHLATSLAQTYRVDLDQPLALLQEALQVAETSGDLVAQAETEWNVAQHYFYRAKAGTALPHAERALALAREIGRKELIARALNILAYLKAQWFQWAESAACAEETKALYAELGDRAMLTDSLCLVAQARLSLGQPTAAIDAARAGLVIAEEIENPWGKVNGAFHLALSMAENGDYTAALAYAQQAVALARTLNLNALLCIVHLVLGRVYAALGNLEAARRAYLEAEEFSNAMTARPFSAPVAVALCADCTLTNEWAEAYAWAAKFLEVRDASLDFHAGLVFWPIVEALLQAGETDRAREEVQRFEGLAGDNPRYQIPHLRSLALLAEWDDNSALAITYLEEASGLTEEIGLPGEQWPIQIKLAELYQAVGDKVWAQWAMRRAAEIVQALAAKIDDEGLRAGFLARALKGLGDYA
jgi:tetratricopeptide (TPR) repeat protein